jgi:hypothetical protein
MIDQLSLYAALVDCKAALQRLADVTQMRVITCLLTREGDAIAPASLLRGQPGMDPLFVEPLA